MESLEDSSPLIVRDSRAIILDNDRAAVPRRHEDRSTRRRVLDGILDEIPKHEPSQRDVPIRPHGCVRCSSGEIVIALEGERRNVSRYLDRARISIEWRGREHELRVELRKTEQLIDEPAETFDLEPDVPDLLGAESRLQPCPQDGKWRAQLVGGMRRELTLRTV